MFSDKGTFLRAEKHEGSGGFGLLVQGVDLLHLERSHKCPFIAERLHYPLINSGSTNPDYPKRCDGIYVLIGGTKIKTINAKMDRKKNGNIPAKIPSKVMSLPSGI